ncbi:MAG: bifunctional hydroxymethylpyrimidine kinase/phosphomethylpyrimidine kinase, partial [Propionibacteriaceae bacterium]|nr:bifunctional hydroxymethylpyrimidine kinase/phosphomethylpyrimidine kinase [Propionibacteriaceae bacterium]
TLNPAIDLTVTVTGLELGHSHRVGPSRRRAGGKGVNVARVLTHEGIRAAVIAPIGGDSGAEFARDLEHASIPAELIASDTATRLSTAVYEADTGRATLFNEHGAPLSPSTRRALLAAIRDRAAGCIVIAGSLSVGTPVALVGDIVTAARERGIPTVVDASGEALLAAAAAGATVAKANLSEISAATGLSDPQQAARQLLRAGAHWVVVTSGSSGLLATDGDILHQAAPPVTLAGNPTGAGDAATAAIAASILESGADALTEPVTIARAVAWSASAVLAPVAGELSPRWREFLADARVATEKCGIVP